MVSLTRRWVIYTAGKMWIWLAVFLFLGVILSVMTVIFGVVAGILWSLVVLPGILPWLLGGSAVVKGIVSVAYFAAVVALLVRYNSYGFGNAILFFTSGIVMTLAVTVSYGCLLWGIIGWPLSLLPDNCPFCCKFATSVVGPIFSAFVITQIILGIKVAKGIGLRY